jgi:hypothetical protein
VQNGLNLDAGIFVSYIGLFSYYNLDNWTYQPFFVSSNPPWYFNGLRIQWFPSNKLKIEPWIVKGWQAYARFSGNDGLGGQIYTGQRVAFAGIEQLKVMARILRGIPPRAPAHRRQHRGQVFQ